MTKQSPPPIQIDPEVKRQREIHLQITSTLRRIMPPVLNETEEARALRYQLALVKIAETVPANAVEVDFAVFYVATMEHSAECLAEVETALGDTQRCGQLRAQSARMGRESRGWYSKLLAAQAARRRREKTQESATSAAYTEHAVHGWLTEAMESLPPRPLPVAAPVAPVAKATPAVPAAAPVTQPRLRDYDEWTDEEKHKDRVRWEADRYAIINTIRVQEMRKFGGIPPDADYESPRPEVLNILLTSNSLNMKWVDNYKAWVPPDQDPDQPQA